MKTENKILIIGAGAVGGIIAAILKREGYTIQLVTKHPETADLIGSDGIEIFGFCGRHRIQIPSVASIAEVRGVQDVIFIATKATELTAIAQQILPLLDKNSRVVSLQNGIVEEELAKIVGSERTVGCIVGWGATMHEKGKMEMTSNGEFVIGYLNQPVDNEILNIKEMLNHIVPVTYSNEIMSHLYSKLIINACISTLGAISGLTLGRMLIRRSARRIFICIIAEAIAVADALGLKVQPYAGKLDYYKFLKWPGIQKNIFLLAFGSKYRKLKSSSLQSLERGRRTEVDCFNGYISNKAAELGVKTPVNALLTRMVHEIESNKRNIHPSNLKDPGFFC